MSTAGRGPLQEEDKENSSPDDGQENVEPRDTKRQKNTFKTVTDTTNQELKIKRVERLKFLEQEQERLTSILERSLQVTEEDRVNMNRISHILERGKD